MPSSWRRRSAVRHGQRWVLRRPAGLADQSGPRLIYTNVARRADHPDPRPGNQGERLVAARCANGVIVVSVNAQRCFSFLRGVADVRAVDVPDPGSQVRSHDLFPAAVAGLA